MFLIQYRSVSVCKWLQWCLGWAMNSATSSYKLLHVDESFHRAVEVEIATGCRRRRQDQEEEGEEEEEEEEGEIATGKGFNTMT